MSILIRKQISIYTDARTFYPHLYTKQSDHRRRHISKLNTSPHFFQSNALYRSLDLIPVTRAKYLRAKTLTPTPEVYI